jgi:hypothetical protein
MYTSKSIKPFINLSFGKKKSSIMSIEHTVALHTGGAFLGSLEIEKKSDPSLAFLPVNADTLAHGS